MQSVLLFFSRFFHFSSFLGTVLLFRLYVFGMPKGVGCVYKKRSTRIYCVLNTNEPSSEYVCKQYYQVSLESADFGAKQAKGYFTIYLVTASELSSTESLDSNNAVFESNSVHRRLVSVQAPLKSTEVVSAFITYKRGWNPLDYWWYENKWMFKKVQVLSADSQLKVNLCPVEEMLDEDASIKYVRC